MSRDPEAKRLVSKEVERYGFSLAVERIGVNKGLVYRAWKHGTHSPTLRKALDLPPRTVPVPPCPDCGKVHEQKATCDSERQRNKRTAANGWHRRAAWVHRDDLEYLERALRYRGARNVQELIDDLIECEKNPEKYASFS